VPAVLLGSVTAFASHNTHIPTALAPVPAKKVLAGQSSHRSSSPSAVADENVPGGQPAQSSAESLPTTSTNVPANPHKPSSHCVGVSCTVELALWKLLFSPVQCTALSLLHPSCLVA